MTTAPASAASRADAVGRLHVLTDDRVAVLPVVEAALRGGAEVIQVRAKAGTDREQLATITAVVAACRRAGATPTRPYGATCLVNDRCDLALAAGAHGVHLGDDDLPVPVARRLLGPRAVIGATARDAAAARARVAEGADYLGVGPVHATVTKDGLPAPIGPAGVGAVAAAVTVPVIAIGALDADRVPAVLAAGASGVAVVGAVTRAEDPRAATAALRAVLDAHRSA